MRSGTAIVCATGPSFADSLELVREAAAAGAVIFGMNNMYRDLALDVHTACDPLWWKEFGKEAVPAVVQRGGVCYHWHKEVVRRMGITYWEGRWGDGLSVNSDYIHYGHSSGYQLLNMAYHYGVKRILLVGFDMRYQDGQPRHYFKGVSNKDGEYPAQLRKYSTFDGLLKCYKTVADQQLDAEILNCTPGSKMQWFNNMKLDLAVNSYL